MKTPTLMMMRIKNPQKKTSMRMAMSTTMNTNRVEASGDHWVKATARELASDGGQRMQQQHRVCLARNGTSILPDSKNITWLALGMVRALQAQSTSLQMRCNGSITTFCGKSLLCFSHTSLLLINRLPFL
jgi:hypothetical protein